jgi:hypothetical protein
MGVAGFGDPAPTYTRPARVFRGDEAEERHQLAGVLDASDVAHFGDEAYGRDEGDAAQRLQRLHHGGPAPRRRELSESPWPASVVCGTARHLHRHRVTHEYNVRQVS